MDKYFNIDLEVQCIIADFTKTFMYSAVYEPKDEAELYEFMVDGCAEALTADFLSGAYTPMQFNAIRNALSTELFELFEEYLY